MQLWHPVFDCTRFLRHSLGIKRENIVPAFFRRSSQRRKRMARGEETILSIAEAGYLLSPCRYVGSTMLMVFER